MIERIGSGQKVTHVFSWGKAGGAIKKKQSAKDSLSQACKKISARSNVRKKKDDIGNKSKHRRRGSEKGGDGQHQTVVLGRGDKQ